LVGESLNNLANPRLRSRRSADEPPPAGAVEPGGALVPGVVPGLPAAPGATEGFRA
jgi:hypothetical protein